ncbi:MAG: acyl-CoA/acyl-ACP dehydrogenase [Gemmatimonadetes bacterium]|nr:acyl-CoA/acyl-ACP dehydrogenase [Gemmatimonadota bacterium]NNF13200.1 acyl-CoA/acyl-ACP dehydrogenase [Gemmatimonadota bacterium]
MATFDPSHSVLTDDMLGRFWDRAPGYDRDNTFFHEDFEEMRDAGYLKLCVPESFGGGGARLARVAAEQRRLAYHAPATALATNMHFYWTGVAADLHRAGDSTCDWMLEEAADGGVFAAGHGERGNDLPLLLSTSTAEPVEGGYRVNGHKGFGSLTPVWTRLGLHAMDSSNSDEPKIIHAFMKREAEGYRIEETWDALGMRATRSDDTILEDVFIPDEDIAYVVPAGAGGMNLFVLGIFAWAETTFSSIYLGLADRAKDIAAERLAGKSSMALESGAYKHHPEFQHAFAEMVMDIDGGTALAERYAVEWDAEVGEAASWEPERAFKFAWRSVSMKHQATAAAFRAVDRAIDVVGGFGVSRGGPLERLFRDARMGKLHPGNFALTHELIAKVHLGIDLDASPRWG